MRSFYYLTSFVVCSSYLPNWAVAFIFPMVLGTVTSPGKYPIRIREGEDQCKHARMEVVAVICEMR